MAKKLQRCSKEKLDNLVAHLNGVSGRKFMVKRSYDSVILEEYNEDNTRRIMAWRYDNNARCYNSTLLTVLRYDKHYIAR